MSAGGTVFKLGPVHIDGDSIIVAPSAKRRRELLGQLGVHVEHPWSDCVRRFDAPLRIYLHLGPLGALIVGLPTLDAGRLTWTRTQRWTPSRGWRHGGMAVVAFSPHRNLQCDTPIAEPPQRAAAVPLRSRCGGWRWHRCPHRSTG